MKVEKVKFLGVTWNLKIPLGILTYFAILGWLMFLLVYPLGHKGNDFVMYSWLAMCMATFFIGGTVMFQFAACDKDGNFKADAEK